MWLNVSVCLNKTLYLYFYFNEFEIIYLDSVYFVGGWTKAYGGGFPFIKLLVCHHCGFSENMFIVP